MKRKKKRGKKEKIGGREPLLIPEAKTFPQIVTCSIFFPVVPVTLMLSLAKTEGQSTRTPENCQQEHWGLRTDGIVTTDHDGITKVRRPSM